MSNILFVCSLLKLSGIPYAIVKLYVPSLAFC